MDFRQLRVGLALFTTIYSVMNVAQAQNVPVATQQLQPSVFVGAAKTFTDLDGCRNRDITAGADLTFLTFLLIKPPLEVRGTYPIDKGQSSSQKNFLAGPKVGLPLGRLHPYADPFFGRGKIDYNNFVVGEVQYLSSQHICILAWHWRGLRPYSSSCCQSGFSRSALGHPRYDFWHYQPKNPDPRRYLRF